MKKKVDVELSLGQFLGKLYPDSSKSTLKSWLRQGRIWVDGKMNKKWVEPLKPGQVVEVVKKERVLAERVPILYEDSDLVALDKPAGLLSVSTPLERGNTLHALVKAHYKPRKVYVIHRLDQDTSGVMLFALSEKGYRGLKKLFKEHDIERRYYALVEGSVEKKKGVWDNFLEEDNRFRMHIREDSGVRAVTKWKLIHQGKEISAIECTLETGKKNQIRVQAAHNGHPVVGDDKYGAKSDPLRRLCLHATDLQFDHPVTEKKMKFHSNVPKEFLVIQNVSE